MLDEEDELPELELPSSCHLSRLLLRAFMKKLLTVLSSNPSCWEMVICNSLDGRLFSLNIACRVRRWTSVKTNRGFLGVFPLSFPCSCSFLLHAARKGRAVREGWQRSIQEHSTGQIRDKELFVSASKFGENGGHLIL